MLQTNNTVLPRLLFCLLVLLLSVGSLRAADGKDKIEKEVSFIEYKYHYGAYSEAAGRAEKLLKKKLQGEDNMPYRTKVHLLLVRIYEAQLAFDRAEDVLKNTIDEVTSGGTLAVYSYLELAHYFSAAGQFVKARDFYKRGKEVLKDPSERLEREYDLLHVRMLLGEGYTLEAAEKVMAYQDFWRTVAADKVSGDTVLLITEERNDMAYARYMNLLAKINIENGKLEKAGTAITANKKWISEHLGKTHYRYGKCLMNEAMLALIKGEAAKLSAIYADAYFLHQTAPYEQDNLYLLCLTAGYSLNAGDITAFSKYQRKLQMHAQQYMGKNDLSHFGYVYSQVWELYHKGNYNEALKQLDQLSEHFSFLPGHHRFTMLAIDLKKEILLKDARIKAYETLLKGLAEQTASLCGDNSPAAHEARLQIALAEINFGTDFKSADAIFQKSYFPVVTLYTPETNPDNVDYLQGFADLCYKTGRYDSAVVYAEKLQKLCVALYGDQSLTYALASVTLNSYRLTAGAYEDVLVALPELLELESKQRSTTITDERIKLLYMLSELAASAGDIELSRQYSNKSLELLKYRDGIESLASTFSWERAAILLMQGGNYYKAEQLLQKSLKFKKERFDEGAPLMLSVYAALGRLYAANGNYGQADKYLKLYSNYTASLYGTNALPYVKSQLLYGDYNNLLGDLKKAEQQYRESVELQATLLGESHLYLASGMMKLAAVTSRLHPERKEENESKYEQVGQIIVGALGKENSFYAKYLQRTAEFYIQIDENEKAGALLVEAQAYWDERLGNNNKYSADIGLMQGKIAYNLEAYNESEKYYQEARKVYAAIFTKEHPLYAQTTGKLARVYYMQGDHDKAFGALKEIMPIYLAYTKTYFPSLSFREKTRFWNTLREEFEFYNFLVLSEFSGSKEKLVGDMYDILISTKALLLSSDIKLRKRIASSTDTTVVALFNAWVAKKELLTSIISLTHKQLEEQGIEPVKVQEEMEELEKELSARTGVFAQNKKDKRASWKDIQQELLPNEYALEFVRYRHFDQTFTDSVIYAALILHENTREHPEVVLLPNGEYLEKKVLKYYRNSVTLSFEDKNSYSNFWKPVKAVIPDGKTVYVSMEGVYNQLNIETLVNPETGKYVIEENDIVLLTNTRDILSKTNDNDRNPPSVEEYFLLCGNPDFYSPEGRALQQNISSLPGAEKEVKNISNLLASSGKSTTVLMNNQVTEDTLKTFKSPYIFHIATHGYFKEGKDEETEFVSNPLLNSGLVLSGGGDILSTADFVYVNEKPGVLTAYEALNMSFENTALVVLSACETGRGEVQVGEGVLGLQRSFLIAGANAVIMSLFKVNDEVTQKFMSLFYKKMLKTGNKRAAFVATKKEIKTDYPDPINWGAFIMIEADPNLQEAAN